MTPVIEELLDYARQSGLEPSTGAASQMEVYLEGLLQRGKRLSLFSLGDLTPEIVVGRHFRDALNGLLHVRPQQGAEVLDYGAGSGVVGIVWAIFRPDLHVTLLESMGRKAFFLFGARDMCKLDQVGVYEGRGEDLAGEHGKELFDIVVSRGIPASGRNLEAVRDLLRPFGVGLFFKGPESAEAFKEAVRTVRSLTVVGEKQVSLGESKRRIFVTVKKVVVE